jgi:hypothetical protein
MIEDGDVETLGAWSERLEGGTNLEALAARIHVFKGEFLPRGPHRARA